MPKPLRVHNLNPHKTQVLNTPTFVSFLIMTPFYIIYVHIHTHNVYIDIDIDIDIDVCIYFTVIYLYSYIHKRQVIWG